MNLQTEQAYIEQAKQFAAKNQLNQVESTLTQAQQKFPNSTDLITHLAYFYLSTNRPNKAAHLFEKRCQMDEPTPKIIRTLVDIYEKHQNYERAIYWYQQLVKHEDNHETIEPNIKRLQKKYIVDQSKKRIQKLIPKFLKKFLQSLAIFILKFVEPKSDFVSLNQYLKFAKGHDPTFLKDGIAYHKARELWLAQNHIPIKDGGLKILDLGTGKNSSPLFWSTFGNDVIALDGSAYGFSTLSNISKQLGLTSFNMAVGDMRQLPFKQNQFDAVTALCAIEHIPDDGDMNTMREIFRVTKPGGIVVVTIEASPYYHEQWMEVPYEVGYQVSDPQKTASTWESVFCRNYTLESIQQRLLMDLQWQVIDMGFYDDLSKQVRRFFSPEQTSFLASLLRPFQPILTFLYYTQTQEPKTPSAIGYLILQKPL